MTESIQQPESRKSPFRWNKGAWLGSQIGCTLWIGFLSATVLSQDLVTGLACFGIFIALNLWGWSLWRARHLRSNFDALRLFLLSCVPAYAAICAVISWRRASVGSGDSTIAAWRHGSVLDTGMPLWIVAVPLVVLFVLHRREHA